MLTSATNWNELEKPNWHELIPTIFTDRRFVQTGRRRYVVQLNDKWAGIAVAWKPPGRENYGLNCEDLERLIEKMSDGSLDAGFVVLATLENSKAAYIAHREVDAVRELLKDEPLSDGPYGAYWLLRGDFTELEKSRGSLEALLMRWQDSGPLPHRQYFRSAALFLGDTVLR